MVEILLFFIGASLLLYVLLGGADYGAGILELLPLKKWREEQKDLINAAMGPVWEANHMWLILIVVILFMGFPLLFTTLMTSLHIPMVALLIGIVLRGSVFTFRHYDAQKDDTSQKLYTWLFGLSSLWTSLWLGIIAASLSRGLIDLEARDFHSAYIAPWWGLYPLVQGFFVVCIFSFLASVYLIGETSHPELQKIYIRRACVLNIFLIAVGALVFVTSSLDGSPLLKDFISHPWALACMGGATLLFFILWIFITKRYAFWTRIASAGQVTLILLGWYFLYAPHAILTKQGPLNFFDVAAPTATLKQLTYALLVGSVFIFPSLIYLMKIFKSK
ncbi:MAG: cytochrome d ubiquinol oxidase subunit II [Bdellovibrio sp.]